MNESSATREHVDSALAAWWDMTRSGDWRRWPDLFTADGTVMNSALDEPAVGRDAIAAWVDTWADWRIEVDWEWVAIDGPRIVIGWRERYPDGSPPDEQPSHRGILTLVYAGDGCFSSFENFFDLKRLEAITG